MTDVIFVDDDNGCSTVMVFLGELANDTGSKEVSDSINSSIKIFSTDEHLSLGVKLVLEVKTSTEMLNSFFLLSSGTPH